MNATVTSVTPDNKSETLTPAEGEGSTLITRPHELYDIIGKTASVRVLSDGRFIEPVGTLHDRLAQGAAIFFMSSLAGMVLFVMFDPSRK